jgi:hypothetical protein
MDKRYIDDLKKQSSIDKLHNGLKNLPRDFEPGTITREVGIDKNGRIAEFDIISHEFEWKYKDTDTKDLKSDFIDADIVEYLSNIKMKTKLNNVLDIICVGTASCEKIKLELEVKRAEERAIQLCELIKKVNHHNDKIQMYTLNLGIFKDKDCTNKSQTSYQRKALIIGVIKKNKDVILEESIRDGLKKVIIPKFTFSKAPFKIQLTFYQKLTDLL